jgi:predicted DNA-binding transcriptional regulator AlpA
MTARRRRDRPLQLLLSLTLHPPEGNGQSKATLQPQTQPLDSRMNTAEVQRVTGVHRTTLYRWTRTGDFPGKHHSGGWLRSDVELWLSRRTSALEVASQHSRERRHIALANPPGRA